MSTDLTQNLLALIQLQEVDTKINQFQRELATIPEKLDEAGGAYLVVKKQIDAKQAELDQMNKERLGLEQAVKEGTTTLQEREKRLYTIKTQKEYQAAVREITLAKKENKDREDRILKLMETGEALVKEITQLKTDVADKETEFHKVEGEFQARAESLKKEKEALEGGRPVLLETIPPVLLARYQTVQKRYFDAIVAVVKGICQGCRMNIPPQRFNEMLKAKELANCPHCFRLIYPKMD